jgi:glycosyltransferase involved in cell wall biosynthesis
MRVVVVVPCYNGGQYVGRCIEAILAQSCQADEVLVIDDGSTDDSARIAAHYPVRLIRHSANAGLSAARNTALRATEADILAYVDVDAYADAGMLAALLPHFTAPEVGGVGGQGIEAIQKTLYDVWRGLHARQSHGSSPRERCEHLFGLCMAYRRAALLQVNGFDERLRTNAEDVDIGYRLNDAGYRLAYTPQAQVYHQRQDTQASLRRMIHSWYYWAFIVKRQNRRRPETLVYGTLRRFLWSDTWPDLLARHSWGLTRINLEAFAIKMQALWQAARIPETFPKV